MANSSNQNRPTPTISTSPDEGQTSRRGGGGGGRRRPNGGGSSSSIAINLVLAILVAGLMVAGWFLANQHQILNEEQQARKSAEQRLVVLEDRLRVTDEALTETGADTGKQINRWESEIRKLWAVANERNKDWIKANEAAVAAGAKQTESLQASLQASQQKLQQQLATLNASVTKLGKLRGSIAAVDKKTQDVAATQREMVGRVNAARQAVASLQAGLTNRVEENEQAVASMDAYRSQLNRRLVELERALVPPISG
jgi:DNA repair exonuclease SbcCD ATPase subunit